MTQVHVSYATDYFILLYLSPLKLDALSQRLHCAGVFTPARKKPPLPIMKKAEELQITAM